MAASPLTTDGPNAQPPAEKWNSMDVDPVMGDTGDAGNTIIPGDERHGAPVHGSDNPDYARASSAVGDGTDASGNKSEAGFRGEKQVKPNKVYIGGLPEHTRKEDLESCFGKIGNIVNIELKVGYGFVEFDNREAAEESVAKYHEGYFMGNKIRVELSHGGGRTAKYSGDPGACFKCGQMGHWARECPNHASNGHRRVSHTSDAPLIDRIQPPRDYPPPPRDYPPYRDDYGRYPPPRDVRYPYEYPPPPPGRDYRRPPSPHREYRDYPPAPPVRATREYDDYRLRGPPPPPPPPPIPPPRYESRPGYYPPEGDAAPPGYPPRYGPPPPRDYYDRYERRPGPPERYGSYPPPPVVRPRTPPGGPPSRAREEFDRPPARDYVAPPELRTRPASPPASRYPDYPTRTATTDAPARYRRRSQSPPPRAASGAYESAGYQAGAGGASYTGGSSGGFAGNGYPSSAPGGAPPRSAGTGRDYPSRPPRESGEPSGSYRRP